MPFTFTVTIPDCCGVCDTCPTEGDLDSDNGTFTDCGCVQGVDLNWYKIIGFTGIEGPQVITMLGPGEWNSVIGTVSVQKYTAAGCATPDGGPTDLDVIQDIVCEDSEVSVLISAPSGFLPAGGALFVGAGAFDEEIANTFGCGVAAGFIDTVTVSIP